MVRFRDYKKFVLTKDILFNLCTSKNAIFVATGVCDGWIPGVQYNDDSANTWSRIIYVETGEMKTIKSVHSLK